MKHYLRLVRPHHWLKNLLVFLPLIFSHSLHRHQLLLPAAVAFAAFCLSSSIIYILNDVVDLEKDKLHTTKRLRPLPAGQVTVGGALGLAGVLLLGNAALCFWLLLHSGPAGAALLGLYIAVNLIYSFWGKNRPILDVFLLMSGFLLRVLVGSAATGIPVSSWMYLTIMSGAFYLGFGKRRNELGREKGTRQVLRAYNRPFLDKAMYLCLGLALNFYSLWCMNTGGSLLFSVPLLLAICFKYSLAVERDCDGDPVEVVVHDPVLLMLIGLYAAFILVSLYVLPAAGA